MSHAGYYSRYPLASAGYPAGFNRRTGQLAVSPATAGQQLAGAFQTFPAAGAGSAGFLAGCTENDVLLNLMIIAMSVFALRDQIFGEDFAAARRRRRRRDLDLDLDLAADDLEDTVVILGQMYDRYKSKLSEIDDHRGDVDKTDEAVNDPVTDLDKDLYKSKKGNLDKDLDINGDTDVDKTVDKHVDDLFKRMRRKLYQANDVISANQAVESLGKLLIDLKNVDY